MALVFLYQILCLFWTLIPAGGSEPTGEMNSVQDCVECHSGMIGQQVMHPAVEDACDNCHLSTGNAHPVEGVAGFTLPEPLPGLCYICHEELPGRISGHQPVEQKECLSCHDPHGSAEPGLIRLPEQELCLSCHREIRTLVRGKAMVHSAIEIGGCVVCHLPHGSDHHTLLIEQYPAEEYVQANTGSFELCFMCHDTDLMDATETGTGTSFRDGLRNLHQLHIEGNKGRNCNLCHDIHGSDAQYLIGEIIPFGKWEMSMNFIPEANGGSCLPGCHGKKSYERSDR